MGIREVANIQREIMSTVGFGDTSRFVRESSDEELAQYLQQMREAAKDNGDEVKAQADLEKAKIQAQVDLQKAQMQAETELAKEYIKMGGDQNKAAAEARMEAVKMQVEAGLRLLEIQTEEKLGREKIKADKQKAISSARAGGRLDK